MVNMLRALTDKVEQVDNVSQKQEPKEMLKGNTRDLKHYKRNKECLYWAY